MKKVLCCSKLIENKGLGIYYVLFIKFYKFGQLCFFFKLYFSKKKKIKQFKNKLCSKIFKRKKKL